MSLDQTASQAPVVLDKFPNMALPALYRAAIGSINTTYYLKLFTQFEAEGRVGLSWNWVASLSTVNWLLFRKLMLPLVAYLVTVVILLVLVMGTGRLILHWAPAVEWAAWAAVATALFGFPGFLGNGLFYRQCRGDIERAIQISSTLEEACQALSARASTRVRLVRIVAANLSVLAIGLALVLTLTNRASDSENTQDNAPAPLRQNAGAIEPASVIEPVSAIEPASVVGPASATAVQAQPPAAPVAAPTPLEQLTSALPIVPSTTVAPAPTEHHVNVGLFADPDNARRAYVKLVKAGLPASREVMMLRHKRVTRVRSGPYDSRRAAQAAVTRIQALQLDAVLAKPKATDYIADQTTPNRP